MTHSKHRRKGLFQKLALLCFENLRAQNQLFIIGFGGGQSTPGFLKFGWKHIFDVRYYFYPKVFSYFRLPSYGDIKEVTNLSDIGHLLPKSNEAATIHSVKSVEICKWRYSNPHYSYKIIAHQKDGKYISYLVYYESAGKLTLFDFYFQDHKSGKVLLNYLKGILMKSNCKGIIAFCQEGSMFSRLLSRYRFIYNPFQKGPLSLKTPFIFYAPESVMEQFSGTSHWLINAFDHDSL